MLWNNWNITVFVDVIPYILVHSALFYALVPLLKKCN